MSLAGRIRRIGPVAMAVAIVALAAGLVGSSSVGATDNGTASGIVTLSMNGGSAGSQESESSTDVNCGIEATFQGQLRDSSGDILERPETYNISDRPYSATVDCGTGSPITVSGVYNGRVTENERQPSYGNDVLDGMSVGDFDFHVVADTRGGLELGTLRTIDANMAEAMDEEEQPIRIHCREMDLRTRPAMYTCTLKDEISVPLISDMDGTAGSQEGSDAGVMVTALTLTFREEDYVPPPDEMPKGGFPPEASGSSGVTALTIVLAVAGLSLVLGAGGYAASRRE